MNKRVLLISATVAFFLGLAAMFGAYTWYMAKPEPRGYFHDLNDMPAEQLALLVEQCQQVGQSEEVLQKVVDQNDLVAKYGAENREEAVEILREKAYVELSSSKKGLQFMVKGLRKDKDFTQKVSKSFYVETIEAMTPKKDEF